MDVDFFFRNAPAAGDVFRALLRAATEMFPDATVRAQKTQISLCDPRPFCWCWLAGRRPDAPLMVGFSFVQRVDSPRILCAVEPYPGRWMHHVPVPDAEHVDEELLAWIGMSHAARCGSPRRKDA